MTKSLKSQLPSLWVAVAKTFHTTSPKSLETVVRLSKANPEFLFKTLPQLGKDLDTALEVGFLQLTPGFFKKLKGACYPVFLKEYFNKIFMKEGYIKADADLTILRELRTLCYFIYKFELPFSKEDEGLAYEKFKAVDNEVKTSFLPEQLEALRPEVAQLLPDDPMDIRPRHSSGASADKFTNAEKRSIKRYIPSLTKVYGLDLLFNSTSHVKYWMRNNSFETHEPSSRVALVPKDSRGPRIICIEPHEKMFFQKGIMHKWYDFIENDSPARGRINFTDQTINQRLAYESSISQKYATIDLKDASDLVSWELVQQVFPSEWVDALRATRSAFAELPDEMVELKKFAPMGSALCFPVEAIIFYSICRLVTHQVWVYGDDIIVPTEKAVQVMDLLESYGLRINRDKSLYRGFFRESCGGDFYKGYNITPIRCKSVDLESTYALANNLSKAFSIKTGEACIRWYESIMSTILLRLPLDYEDKTSLLAFFTDVRNDYLVLKRKWHDDHQTYLVRGLCTHQHAKSFHRYKDKGDKAYDMLFDYFTSTERSNSPKEDSFYRELAAEWNYNHQVSTGIKLQEFIDSSCVSTSSVFREIKTSLKHKWVASQP